MCGPWSFSLPQPSFPKNTDRQKADAGVFEDTVRVSVGIEDAEDLIEDFLTALASAG